MSRRAVLFDLGGVVLGSPLQAIRDYELELGFERNAINRVAADTAPSGAWSRLERGEIDMPSFYRAFEQDCARAGLEIDARAMMERMAAASAPRPRMLSAIGRLRDEGLRVGALTNNWAHAEGETASTSSSSPASRACASRIRASTPSPASAWSDRPKRSSSSTTSATT